MPRVRRRRALIANALRSERGSTLVELLVATAIMGIAVVGLLVGSSVTLQTSAQNRTQTNAGIVARNYAESLSEAVSSGELVPDDGRRLRRRATRGRPATRSPRRSVRARRAGRAVPERHDHRDRPNGDTETLKTVVRQP